MRSTVRQGAKPWEGHQAWHELAVACTRASTAELCTCSVSHHQGILERLKEGRFCHSSSSFLSFSSPFCLPPVKARGRINLAVHATDPSWLLPDALACGELVTTLLVRTLQAPSLVAPGYNEGTSRRD